MLLRMATELAGDGGDINLALHSAAAIDAEWEVDFRDLKRRAFQSFVASDTPMPDDFAAGTEDQVVLGDAYWDRAEKAGEADRNRLWQLAAPWYRQAQPKVTVKEVKSRLAARLAEVGKLEAALAEAKRKAEEARLQQLEDDKALVEAKEAMRREADYAATLKPAEIWRPSGTLAVPRRRWRRFSFPTT